MLIEDISKDLDIANLICQILGTDVTCMTPRFTLDQHSGGGGGQTYPIITVLPSCEFGAIAYMWNSMFDTDFLKPD